MKQGDRAGMNEMNTLERNRRYARITPEERRLIDEAIAQGRVTRVPTGASAFRQDYVWARNRDGKGMKLQRVGESDKPGAAWHRDIDEQARARISAARAAGT